MATGDLLERISRGPILCDGAMKTELIAHAAQRGVIPDAASVFSTGYCNIEHPELVEAVHRSYLDAGAELIITNTFKASSIHVLKMGRAQALADASRESTRLVDAATKIARRVCDDDAWVLGDIGSIGQYRDLHGGEKRVLREEFRRQARAMRDAGADAMIVEYMWDPIEMALAVEASKDVADWPVMATPVYARWEATGDVDYRTLRAAPTVETAGVTIDDMVKAAIEAGADVVGAHCGVLLDVTDYLAIAEQTIASPHRPTHVPVIIQPNGSEKGRPLGGATGKARPQALADSVPRFLDLGVRILGGCCGTTPEDVRAMSDAMRRHGQSHDTV